MKGFTLALTDMDGTSVHIQNYMVFVHECHSHYYIIAVNICYVKILVFHQYSTHIDSDAASMHNSRSAANAAQLDWNWVIQLKG